MAYLGNDLQVAFPVYRNIDDISGSFNSSTTSFPLRVSGVAPVPAPLYSQQCLISVGGVVQRPDDTGSEGFRLSGGNIIFASAPTTGADFFGVILAGADYINAGGNFPSGTAAVPSITFNDDLDTGIYNSGINQVSITTGGSERLRIDSAGQIESVSLGTAAAPAFSFTTDPNSGIYSPGADQVAISTNSTGRLFVDASGNVGVGSISTSSFQSASSTVLSLRDVATSNVASLKVLGGAGAGAIAEYGATNGIGFCGTSGAHAFTFYTNSAERLRITSAGLVGVGTSSPSRPLHVVGSAVFDDGTVQATIWPQIATNVAGFGTNNNYPVALVTNGSQRLHVTATGNVGVGTTSPGLRLDIAATGDDGIRFSTTGTSNSARLELSSGNGTTSGKYAYIKVQNNDTNAQGYAFGTFGDDRWVIRDTKANSERLCITSAGNVGIGTSSPSGLLTLGWNSSTGINAGLIGQVNNSAGANNGYRIGLRTSSDASNWCSIDQAFNNLGTDASTYIAFTTTAGYTAAERMRLTSTGLGIGTTSPGVALDVNGITRTSSYFSANDNGYIRGDTAGELRIQPGTNGTVFRNASNSAEYARIDSSGRLLVGTSTDRSSAGVNGRFQLEGTTYNTSSVNLINNGNDNQPAYLVFGKSRSNSVGGNTVVQSGDYLGRIDFAGADGSNLSSVGATIGCQVDGTPGTNDMPGRLVFSTTPDSGSSPVERLRIASNGKTTIKGATSDSSAYSLEVTESGGIVQFTIRNDGVILTGTDTLSPYNNTTASAANLVVTSGGELQRSTSSLKYKKNVQDAPYGLQELMALRAVTYQGKSTSDGDTVYGGLIAEEVDAAGLQEFVQYADDGTPDALAYGNMVSLCIKAIQEQQAMIVELQAKVAALESA